MLANSMPYGTEFGGTSMCRTGNSVIQSFPNLLHFGTLAIHLSTRRFGASDNGYALPVSGPICWQRVGNERIARFELPPMPKDTLIVPSLSVVGPGCDWSATWHFRNGDKQWQLDRIPAPECAGAENPPPPSEADLVETQIDCFVTKHDIEVSFLELHLHARDVPERALVVVATGASTRRNVSAGVATAAPCPVQSISQMQAEDAAIRKRICSPTSLAMVMGLDAVETARFTAECYDPYRRMYGVWPHNIRAANAYGFTGAIEIFESLDAAAELLATGLPIIAGIRYGKGQLAGAAVPSTAGHLVVLRGLTRDEALVNDPAAATSDSVARAYERESFARAWLGERGVGYVLNKAV
ncbi:MAG: C39 family peptidase [Gammaproteobacteria bacterium]|nr:C39 family peptidase [Gammaproteobacteria bacterium]